MLQQFENYGRGSSRHYQNLTTSKKLFKKYMRKINHPNQLLMPLSENRHFNISDKIVYTLKIVDSYDCHILRQNE